MLSRLILNRMSQANLELIGIQMKLTLLDKRYLIVNFVVPTHRVKLYSYSKKSALQLLCLKLVTNMSGYGYLYQKMKMNEGFWPKPHILPMVKNFPEIGPNYNKIYDVR